MLAMTSALDLHCGGHSSGDEINREEVRVEQDGKTKTVKKKKGSHTSRFGDYDDSPLLSFNDMQNVATGISKSTYA